MKFLACGFGLNWRVGGTRAKRYSSQLKEKRKQRTVYWVTLLLDVSQLQLENIGQSYHPAATTSANLDKKQWSWPVFWLRNKAREHTSRHRKEEVVKWKTWKRDAWDPLSSFPPLLWVFLQPLWYLQSGKNQIIALSTNWGIRPGVQLGVTEGSESQFFWLALFPKVVLSWKIWKYYSAQVISF